MKLMLLSTAKRYWLCSLSLLCLAPASMAQRVMSRGDLSSALLRGQFERVLNNLRTANPPADRGTLELVAQKLGLTDIAAADRAGLQRLVEAGLAAKIEAQRVAAELEKAQAAERRAAQAAAKAAAETSGGGSGALVFEREAMSKRGDGMAVEGYWAGSQDPAKDGYQGQYPFPKAHAEPWVGQAEFSAKLKQIEALSRAQWDCSTMPPITKIEYRGHAYSRLAPGERVGHGEYKDTRRNIVWPYGFRSHYIDRFNVRPSREFYDYVMSFDLAQAERETKAACPAASKEVAGGGAAATSGGGSATGGSRAVASSAAGAAVVGGGAGSGGTVSKTGDELIDAAIAEVLASDNEVVKAKITEGLTNYIRDALSADDREWVKANSTTAAGLILGLDGIKKSLPRAAVERIIQQQRAPAAAAAGASKGSGSLAQQIAARAAARGEAPVVVPQRAAAASTGAVAALFNNPKFEAIRAAHSDDEDEEEDDDEWDD